MLPPSTTSGVLNAKTAPKLAFVLAFVRAVLAYAEANEVPVPAPERDLDLWKRRWEQLYAPPRGDDPAAGQSQPGPGTQPRAAVPWQLPAATRLLLGRDDELAWLDRRLAEAGTADGPTSLLLYGLAGPASRRLR